MTLLFMVFNIVGYCVYGKEFFFCSGWFLSFSLKKFGGMKRCEVGGDGLTGWLGYVMIKIIFWDSINVTEDELN